MPFVAPARPAAPAAPAAVSRPPGETIQECVLRALDKYFDDLGGSKPHALHEMVTTAVERPLLQYALDRCAGNQSAAAELLGINRNTLHKKLIEHKLLATPKKK